MQHLCQWPLVLSACSNSKAASAPTPSGFAFVPYVPFSWTAVVGLLDRQ
jgi:hypothetical protein